MDKRSGQICLSVDTYLGADPIHATPKWDTILMFANALCRVGPMGQSESNEESVRATATRPSVGSAALDTPIIGPFVVAMEAIGETATAPARWLPVRDKIGREPTDNKDRPTRKRDNDYAAGHDTYH